MKARLKMNMFSATVLACLLLICPVAGPSHACTSFCMDTPEGPVFGTNMDLAIPGDGLVYVNQRGVAKAGWKTGTTGEQAEWVSEYGSVTFNLAGREFAWGGMNEAGLVVSSMQLVVGRWPDADERPPIADGVWVQYILDTCDTIEEAVQMASAVRVEDQHYTSHYLVADARGDCAAFEYLDGELVYHVGEDAPVKAMANAPYAAGPAFMEEGVRPEPNPGESVERVAAACARIESYDAGRDTSAIDYAFDTLRKAVVAPHTKWNIVFDIPKREVHYRSAASPRVKRISLDALEFSCDAPLVMLDINAPLKGDVEGRFQPYDHDVNLHIFRTFCDRYGIEVTEEGSAALMEFFGDFECTR
jgi:choloylglycine hydrolase